jgi:hypothetical protein
VTQSSRTPSKSPRKVPPAWDLDRVFRLLKTSLEEIELQRPPFFGTLKIEVNFREGEIETVAVDRRQTFKD